MHLRDPASCRRATTVVTGQPIGFVGRTGDATACHLHFEMWPAPAGTQAGSAVDPLAEPEGLGRRCASDPPARTSTPRPRQARGLQRALHALQSLDPLLQRRVGRPEAPGPARRPPPRPRSRWKTSRQAATRRSSSGIRRSWPEIRRSAEASAAGRPVRAAEPASAASSRSRERTWVPSSDTRPTPAATTPPRPHEPETAAAQHPLAAGEQHGARSADGGHHGGVAVDEVRELVPDDGLELGRA